MNDTSVVTTPDVKAVAVAFRINRTDLALVWRVVERDLPALKVAVTTLL